MANINFTGNKILFKQGRKPKVSTGTSYGSNAFAMTKPRCIPILTHANDDRSEIKYANPYKNCIKPLCLYWSPNAWRPMQIGFFHDGTKSGIFLQIIGSRKTTPPRILRIVPFGERHISFNLNSSTRSSSGGMVAHLTATLYFWVARAESIVTYSWTIFIIEIFSLFINGLILIFT